MLTAKRPSDGLSPMEAWGLAGRPAPADFAIDEVITSAAREPE
jgi:hypothetical protein